MDSSLFPSYPVLIVDDESQSLQSFEIVLRSGGINHVLTCQDSREVMRLLTEREVGILLLDLAMPYVTGQELLEQITPEHPELPVLIMTGANDVETAVGCMKKGAFDYLVKPVEKSRLLSGVRRAIELRELKRENLLLKQNILSEGPSHIEAFAEIITQSRAMTAIFQYVEAIARGSQPALITGETGVGKELMAKAIHTLSGRRGPFVSINVAGLDDEMFADSLFGHKRGAFTGAATARKGLVEQACSGTLFLDEIGDLSVSSQVKLLRLLQEREYFPLGADVPRRADARVICATNQDLDAFMRAGRFRKDLFYRLRTHHIHIPPLRERMDDLPPLVDFFLWEAADQLGKKKPTPPRELFTLLQTHSFPGNIRELKALIYDAVSKHESRILSLESFQKTLFPHEPAPSPPAEEQALAEPPTLRFPEKLPTLRDANQQLVAEALRRSNGNQTIAARLLGISQQALSKRLSREE